MKISRQHVFYAAFALSVALNLIIIGAAGFAAYRFHDMRDDGGHAGGWIEHRLERGERYFMRHLDAPDRQVAKEIFRQRKPAIREAFEELRAARRDFGQSLRHTPPMPEDILPILSRSQNAADHINQEFHGLLRDMATQLSPEARQRLSEHLLRRHGERHADDRRHDDDDD